jgi:ribulose 1,5-bisphosphate synthetase/thiazole synthase
MNVGVVILVIVLGWSLVSIVAALMVGEVAKARDVVATSGHEALSAAAVQRKTVARRSRDLAS